MGLLEHIRHALFKPRRVMHGLYAPMDRKARVDLGLALQISLTSS